MSESKVLIEKVKEQAKGIVEEELNRLKDEKSRLETVVEDTSKRIQALIQSYADLEKSIGEMNVLGLAGVTSDTAKVEILKELENYEYNHLTVDVRNHPMFLDHPSGRYFNLDSKKKYKVLVAFIPVEEKAK